MTLPPAGRTIEDGRLEQELLVRLGLTDGANPDEIEAAHDRLVRFLDGAPAELRPWAGRLVREADEAYALLLEPSTLEAATRGFDPADDRSRTDEQDDRDPAPRRRGRAGAAGTRRPDRAHQQSALRRLVRRLVLSGAIVAGVVAVAYAGYSFGGPTVPGFSGTPAPEASGTAPLDQARVAELMAKIQANPRDIASLQALGDLFFDAADYDTAAGWMDKILALEPKNVTARLALGAARFNAGRPTEAEKEWRAVLAIDPRNLEAHYDLGFMYLSQNPPDVARVKAEWGEVIAIAPDSDVAKTVATHLKSLEASSASASTGPSPSPTSAGSPSASPAASGN